MAEPHFSDIGTKIVDRLNQAESKEKWQKRSQSSMRRVINREKENRVIFLTPSLVILIFPYVLLILLY